MDILELLDKVLEISGVKEKALRSEQVIRLKKRFGLTEFESLEKFEDVYAYAVVEYSLGDEKNPKPKPLVALFKLKEMRETFAAAYRENKPGDWVDKGQKIAQYQLRETPLEGIDPIWEIGAFAKAFFEVLQKTKSAKEIQLDQKLESLQESISEVRKQQPTLEAINQKLNQITGADKPVLPAAAQESRAAELARKLGEWFAVLEYERVPDYEMWQPDYFEWAIDFPAGRRRFSRTLVRGVAGEVEMADVRAFAAAIEEQKADEGWLVGNRRVSKVARQAVKEQPEYEAVLCYTFDELLDEDADFSKYLAWLEGEISAKGVDEGYLPLACRKDDIDPQTQRKMGVSTYAEEDGWIDGYVDMWLDDPAKEHLSVLGEFGTGKTWFALHYAQVALQRYRDAKQRGTERPRIPVVVPLRDYAKAVSVESLFSEFFFRKHEILKNYSVFEQLNRMGKLLLIFDGFDEMAARVDRQAMIDNFWELARVVGPGAKAILTCRTEHFPDAITGRQLLDAELESSTVNLTGETPQFEVLELEKLSDEQIATLIGRQAKPETVQEVMGNSQLLDLARRPVMVELILAALPEIEAGKPVDMARVYLYAVTRKMRNDIRSERTFTSLADKLYFLCELSWKMISTNQMTLNYRAFPEALQQMFADRVKDEKELDHWRYDMMGQTMLIRNAEGDYSPAHRSLLEFFVAYKIVASLGAMAEDFTAVAQEQECVNEALPLRTYTWNNYFRNEYKNSGKPLMIAGLLQFERMGIDELRPLLSQSKLAKAVLNLACSMLDGIKMRERLLPLLQETSQWAANEIGYLGGNVAQLMLAKTPYALVDSNLSRTKLRSVDFSGTYLQRVNLQKAHLTEASFSKMLSNVFSVAYSPSGTHIAIVDDKGILQVWDIVADKIILFCSGHLGGISSVTYSPDGNQLATASFDKTVKIWDTRCGRCIRTLEGHENSVTAVEYRTDGTQLATGSADKTAKLWDMRTGKCTITLVGHKGAVGTLSYSPNGYELVTGSSDKTVKTWDINSGICVKTFVGHENKVRGASYSPDGSQLATGSTDKTVRLWNLMNGICECILKGHEGTVRTLSYSPDGSQLATGSFDKTVKLWDTDSGECIDTLKGREGAIRALSYSPDGTQLATSSFDRAVKLWDVDCKQYSYIFEGHINSVLSIAYSPEGTQLASGGFDKTIKLWNVDSGKCTNTLRGHKGAIRALSYSPDGAQLVTGSADYTAMIWDISSGKYIRTLGRHGSTVWSVAYRPDGTQIATASADNTVRLWNVRDGKCVRILKGHSNSVRSVSYAPNNTLIVTGSADNTTKLWNVDTGRCIRTFEGHSSTIMSVAYRPDGAQIATASFDNTVKLWDINTGNCSSTLRGHESPIWSVAYRPDGAQIATASFDNTVKLWDINTGECVHTQDDRVHIGLNITGAVGLTPGQRAALKLMGAVDYGNE